MSLDQRNQITDVLKWVLWGSISISSFLVANTYNNVETKIDKTYDKLESIEARMIRVEYELKLK